MKKYLIFGNKGQLGKEFEKTLAAFGEQFAGYDLPDVDISDMNQILSVFKSVKPDYVLNCAAYNQVDKAESDERAAYNANTIGVRNLAKAAEESNSFLVHFGSDYIFDGKKNLPYLESDEVNPLSVYGKSKYLGELNVADETDSYLIFRVSWLYGDGSQNFIAKIKEWSRKNKELKIADDESSVPTSTKIVADTVLKALKNKLTGTYHLTNSDFCSRFDWANEIIRLLNIEINLTPVSKNMFNLPAKRPDFSAMSNELISKTLNIEIPDWKFSLAEYLKNNI